jgi:hypothetical protein
VGGSFFNEQFARPCDLTGGLVAWRGYYQSLRPTQGGLTPNLGKDGAGNNWIIASATVLWMHDLVFYEGLLSTFICFFTGVNERISVTSRSKCLNRTVC